MLAPKNAHPEAWADFKAGPSEDDMKYYQHILGAYASYTFKLEKF